MGIVSYYAWFVEDHRPGSRAGGGQEQPIIRKGTKVSVKEEYVKDGVIWCQIWPPPLYEPAEHYPELWVPASVLSKVAPGVPAEPSGVTLEEVARVIRWAKSL